MAELKLQSTSFVAGQPIPTRYAREGDDRSPALAWEGAPAGVKTWALVCDDPDAQSVAGKVWVHWLIWNLPGPTTGLPENVAKTETVAALGNARQGTTDYGDVGYGGPMPPKGHGVHHYHFKLYALDAELAVKPRATKKELEAALKGHILAQAELVGTYERK